MREHALRRGLPGKVVKTLASCALVMTMVPAVALQGAGTAWADEVATEGDLGANLHWAVNDTDGNGTFDRLEITNTTAGTADKVPEAMPDYSTSDRPAWYSYRTDVTSIEIDAGVTTIGNYAFQQFSALTEVDMADVESIGDYAFASSGKLAYANVTGVDSIGNYAFAWCYQLATVEGSVGVSTLGAYAFCGCNKALTTFTLKKGIAIPDYAFANCSVLQNVRNLKYATSVGASAFNGCMVLESADLSSATSIGKNAFQNAKALSSFKAPLIEEVPEGAFYYCNAIGDVSLPKVKTLGAFAFRYATGLTSLELPSLTGASAVGDRAFDGCTGLKSLTIGNAEDVSITLSAGSWGNFANCSALETLKLPGVAKLSGKVFSAATQLKTVELSGSCTDISTAFAGTGIEEIDLPAGLTTIAASAFASCKSLNEIVIPDGVTNIGNGAFSSCTSLEKVTIGKNVSSIGTSIFSGCSALKTIVVAEGNENYWTDGTALYSADKTQLICVSPAAESYTPLASCTSAVAGAFAGLSKLESIDTGNIDLTSVPASMFEGCTGLKSISLPNTVSLGDSAFRSCSALESVSVPKVETVGKYAFMNCTALESIELPKAQSIDSYAFSNVALKDVALPEALTFGMRAYASCNNLETFSAPKAETPGNFMFYGCPSLETASLPSATTIPLGAFYNNASLVSVDVSSAEAIGNSAFIGCTSLAEIALPKATSLQYGAFSGCSALEKVTFGVDGITTIASGIFQNCSKLKEIVLPASVTSLNVNAFKGCTAIEKINLENITAENGALAACENIEEADLSAMTSISIKLPGVKHITVGKDCASIDKSGMPKLESITIDPENPNFAASEDGKVIYGVDENKVPVKVVAAMADVTSVALPETVTEVGDGAFAGCTKLESVTGLDKVTVLGASAFANCTALPEELSFSLVETVGASAFAYTAAKSISLPAATTIGANAFQGNTGLESIVLPEAATLGAYLFSGCTALETASLPKATALGTYSFQNCTALKSVSVPLLAAVPNYCFTGCAALTDIAWAEGDITLGTYAFQDCAALKALPDGGAQVKTIANYALSGCTALESVDLGSATIGQYAFKGCTAVKTLDLSNVASIAKYAFFGCTGLESFVWPTAITTIPQYCFSGCTGLGDVELPEGLLIVDNYAFKDAAMKSLTLPATLTKVNMRAFAMSGCSLQLLKIKSPSTVFNNNVPFQTCAPALRIEGAENPTTYKIDAEGNLRWVDTNNGSIMLLGKTALTGDITVTDGLDAYAYAGCDQITSITCDGNYYNAGCISNCENLESITITSNANITLYEDAFANNPKLKTVTFEGEGTVTVRSRAFANCPNLEQIICNGQLLINAGGFGDSVFEGDGKVEIVPAGYALENDLMYFKDGYYWDSKACETLIAVMPYVENPEIPEGTVRVCRCAFSSCGGVKELTIPESVTTVDKDAFTGAELEKLTINNKNIYVDTEYGYWNLDKTMSTYPMWFGSSKSTLKTVDMAGWTCPYIPPYMFDNCTALETVIIGPSVTKVGVGAFEGCTNLKEVWCYGADTVPEESYVYTNTAFGMSEKVTVPSAFSDEVAASATFYGLAYEDSSFVEWCNKKGAKFVPLVVLPGTDADTLNRIFGSDQGWEYYSPLAIETTFAEDGQVVADVPVTVEFLDEGFARELVQGVDYTVSYEDENGNEVDNTDAVGTYDLVVKACGAGILGEQRVTFERACTEAQADEAAAVAEQLSALTTASSEADVAAARDAYDPLTEAQKALVGEEALAKLESAEQAIADAKQAAADKAAAAAKDAASVAALLEALPENATAADEAQVAAARKAYAALSADQRKLVSAWALDKLTSAEASVATAKAAAAEAATASVKTVTVNVKTVNAKAVDAAVAKAGGSAKYVTTIVLGAKVKKIAKSAFKSYTKVTTLQVKTKKLTKKSVKGCLKGSKVKTVKVLKAKKKAYKKIFTKKVAGKKVKVK